MILGLIDPELGWLNSSCVILRTCVIVGLDYYTDILRIHRHPTNSQTSYEFTDILRIHRHMANKRGGAHVILTSSYKTSILLQNKNPTNSQKSYEFTEIL